MQYAQGVNSKHRAMIAGCTRYCAACCGEYWPCIAAQVLGDVLSRISSVKIHNVRSIVVSCISCQQVRMSDSSGKARVPGNYQVNDRQELRSMSLSTIMKRSSIKRIINANLWIWQLFFYLMSVSAENFSPAMNELAALMRAERSWEVLVSSS